MKQVHSGKLDTQSSSNYFEKKIKILTITTSGLIRKEGISTVILDYYSSFDKTRYQLDIIVSGEYNSDLVLEFCSAGVNIYYFPSRKECIVNYLKEFSRLLKREQYDAIYVHGSSAIMSIELILAKIYGVKIRMVHSHNTTCDHKKADKLLRPIFYRSYTVALACGMEAGKWLYGNRPFDIIKNGRNVDLYRFNAIKRAKIRQQLEVSDNTLLIGHVGNFNEQKNQQFLVLVLKEIVKVNTNVKLFLMGDGATKPDIMNIVTEEKLDDFVVFTGSISNVPDMLQAMDVMLLPSLHEGLPLVVIEWQIAGLPCILSDKVTKECAYTDLVHFLALDDPKVWAKKTLSIAETDREKSSEGLLIKTKENGYDLCENAYKLQKYFNN